MQRTLHYYYYLPNLPPEKSSKHYLTIRVIGVLFLDRYGRVREYKSVCVEGGHV